MKGRFRLVVAAAVIFAVATLAACEPKAPSSPDSLTYSTDARAAYLEAMDVFEAQSWEEARLRFAEVKRLYAHSPYARLADLRLADIEFEQGKYTEATTAYRTFVRAHRSDDNVEYARYRIAKGAYLDIGDTFLLPPAEERDQGNAEEAYRELKAYDEQFPKSRYRADSGYMLAVVMQRLVRHELFVARYYLGDDRFEATIARIEYALARYPGSGLDAEALVLKGETLLKMHRRDAARAAFDVVAKQEGPFKLAAERFLAHLGAEPATPSEKGEKPGVEKAGLAPSDRTPPAAPESGAPSLKASP